MPEQYKKLDKKELKELLEKPEKYVGKNIEIKGIFVENSTKMSPYGINGLIKILEEDKRLLPFSHEVRIAWPEGYLINTYQDKEIVLKGKLEKDVYGIEFETSEIKGPYIIPNVCGLYC